MPKPPLRPQTTTLWEYPSQNYAGAPQGDTSFVGATPSWILWNLLVRYTKPKDLIVDPMCGSGTTLDVARDLQRRGLGYDIAPARNGIFRADARKLPLETGKADFVFVDPPYSDHVAYSGAPECIGELRADTTGYYAEMDKVIGEIDRVLRPGRYLALYVSDSFKKGRPFMPIGFRLFGMLAERFTPVDIITVVRHNAKLKRGNWHAAAVEGNFYLRGFNYLFVFYKEEDGRPRLGRDFPDRRDPEEVAWLLNEPGAEVPDPRAPGPQGPGPRVPVLPARPPDPRRR